MLTEKDVYAVNQHVQTQINNQTYEFEPENLLKEVVDIINDGQYEAVCFHNDAVGELATAVLSEVDVKWRLKSNYRVTYAFAKKLFGLEKENFQNKADIVFSQKTELREIPELFNEANVVVLISPSFSVANLDKFVYDIDLRMYSAIITKKREENE